MLSFLLGYSLLDLFQGVLSEGGLPGQCRGMGIEGLQLLNPDLVILVQCGLEVIDSGGQVRILVMGCFSKKFTLFFCLSFEGVNGVFL